MRLILNLLVCTLALALPAHAAEQLLSRDNGSAASFEKLLTDGHYVQFNSPAWPHTFTEELQLFGYRFGDVGKTLGTIVIWDTQPAPKPTKPPKKGEKAPPTKVARIIASKQFPLSSAPTKAGWFTVHLDPVELPRSFGISVFTRSSETSGLWLGVTGPGKLSHSSAGIIKDMAALPKIRMRRDGGNWLLRLNVRDTVAPQLNFKSSELSGNNFALLDDGGAEGFATSQSDGPLVRFSNPGGRRLHRVFVHAKLGGTSWFNTDRMAGVWVLDENFGILCRGDLPFKRYTNEPSWAGVELPDIALPRTFYIALEPVSRPAAQMLIGYDTGSKNRASYFGNAGAILSWNIAAPEENTNWMIRVEYR
jgi:hypothetical protein